MSPPLLPTEASPTGKPLIPPYMVPWLVALFGVAVAAEQTLPPNTVAAKVAHVLVLAGGLLGLASPGLRRQG